MNIKIEDVRWFTSPKGTVGIVKVNDPYDGISYFISAVEGFNEECDKTYIAEWGARLPNKVGDILFGN